MVPGPWPLPEEVGLFSQGEEEEEEGRDNLIWVRAVQFPRLQWLAGAMKTMLVENQEEEVVRISLLSALGLVTKYVEVAEPAMAKRLVFRAIRPLRRKQVPLQKPRRPPSPLHHLQAFIFQPLVVTMVVTTRNLGGSYNTGPRAPLRRTLTTKGQTSLKSRTRMKRHRCQTNLQVAMLQLCERPLQPKRSLVRKR